VSKVEATEVVFGSMSDLEIEAYVRDGSPMDKAGAYGYQDRLGPFFVESINGDYYNVIGLPLRSLYKSLFNDFPDLVRMA
jgi:septum formation protein